MEIIRREVKCDPGLLKFMYPNFEIVDDNTLSPFPTKPAIYVGTVGKRDEFIKIYNKANLQYILLSNRSEIDLTDRRQLVQVSFEKWGRYVPQYLVGCGREKKKGKGIDMGFIDQMEYDDFMRTFKHHWVTGKWEIKKLPDENTFLDLITAINLPKTAFMKIFFEVVKDTTPYRIESSMMTFLLRVKYKNYRGITSKKYKAAIKMYEGKYYTKSLEALYEALDCKIDNYTLRLLYLLMLMISGNRSSNQKMSSFY